VTHHNRQEPRRTHRRGCPGRPLRSDLGSGARPGDRGRSVRDYLHLSLGRQWLGSAPRGWCAITWMKISRRWSPMWPVSGTASTLPLRTALEWTTLRIANNCASLRTRPLYRHSNRDDFI